jgi:hypothetical protein
VKHLAFQVSCETLHFAQVMKNGIVQKAHQVNNCRKEVKGMTSFEILTIVLLTAANIQLALIVVRMAAKKG